MSAQTDDYDLLTSVTVAREFDVSREAVVLWVREGKLRALKTTNGRHVFLKRDVEEFKRQREQQRKASR